VLAVLWVAGAIVGPTDVAILDLVGGPDGILSAGGGAPLIWLAPVLAGAVAGAALAMRAVRRSPWAGLSMGYLTYALGVLLGTIVVVAGLFADVDGGTPVAWAPGDLLSAIPGTLLLAILGTIVAAPLLVVCAAGGIMWAAVVRRVTPQPAELPAAGGAGLAAVLATIAVALGLLWLAASWFLDLLASTTRGV
jgi:hypothetical protein